MTAPILPLFPPPCNRSALPGTTFPGMRLHIRYRRPLDQGHTRIFVDIVVFFFFLSPLCPFLVPTASPCPLTFSFFLRLSFTTFFFFCLFTFCPRFALFFSRSATSLFTTRLAQALFFWAPRVDSGPPFRHFFLFSFFLGSLHPFRLFFPKPSSLLKGTTLQRTTISSLAASFLPVPCFFLHFYMPPFCHLLVHRNFPAVVCVPQPIVYSLPLPFPFWTHSHVFF